MFIMFVFILKFGSCVLVGDKKIVCWNKNIPKDYKWCCVTAACTVFLDLLGVNAKEYLRRKSQSEEIFCIYSHREGARVFAQV